MDLGRILTRSFEITWRYKLLWVLGFVFVLFGGSGGGFAQPFNYSFNRSDFQRFPAGQLQQQLTVIAGAVICLVLLWLVLSLYFRFVARGAMVTAVRSIEAGRTPGLAAAWREGQTYWGRLFGLGLLVNIPLAIVTIILILIAIVPLVLFFAPFTSQVGGVPPDQGSRIAVAIVGVIGLFCCAILCLILLTFFIKPVYEFAVRGIVLEKSSVVDSLSLAWDRIRANLGSVIILYLIMIGLGFLWGVAVLLVSLPFGLLLGAAILFAQSQSPALIILLILAIGLPLVLIDSLLSGIFESFVQTVWTEAYVAAMVGRSPGPAVAPAAPPPGSSEQPAA